ncbi:c-type cytochrome [Candidatus Sulfurimonas marisnigri]|uniref:C-type cytochrome n=1 Tax=Candidatus Sulfurimonas marisnigri TaxID=2740405 RepID=A0A7S7RQG7_9BACT|nr:c-type cytochrome [Candidatus Sulfurimonas marisnigri]QOY54450.1 c-type cytochrome [Candidatus Sulfurimonas marisnigri]
MKKFILGLSFSILFFSNVIAEDSDDVIKAKGKAIFESKGCTLCHKLDKELIGPSIMTIATAYTGKESSLVSYLSSLGTPIVYPDRAPVMNPQLAKIKTLSNDKMKALATYLVSAADRPRQR